MRTVRRGGEEERMRLERRLAEGMGADGRDRATRVCKACSVEGCMGVTSPSAVLSSRTAWHIQHPPTGA